MTVMVREGSEVDGLGSLFGMVQTSKVSDTHQFSGAYRLVGVAKALCSVQFVVVVKEVVGSEVEVGVSLLYKG